MRQQIVVDKGGTISFDPTESTGRPSSSTLDIYRSGSVFNSLSAETVTVDAVNTTINAAAAIGAESLTLTAVTSIEVGRTYLVTNSLSQHERVRVTGVNTSSRVVSLQEPLNYAYASADTFVGQRLTYAIVSGKADTKDRRFEARWTYAIASTTYYRRTLFDIVRVKWPDVLVTADYFEEYAQELANDLTAYFRRKGLSFASEIATATRDVTRDLEKRHDPWGNPIEIDLFRSFEPFKDPICAYAIRNAARRGRGIPTRYKDDPEQFHEIWKVTAAQALSDALDTADNYDADDSDAVSNAEADAGYTRDWLIL